MLVCNMLRPYIIVFLSYVIMIIFHIGNTSLVKSVWCRVYKIDDRKTGVHNFEINILDYLTEHLILKRQV